MMSIRKIINPDKLSTVIFYSSILTFIIAFNFSDNPPSGWQQQFLPYLNNRPLSDITFLDSLTGYGITGDGTVGDTNYIIKTTNGGDNWFIVNSIYRDLSKLSFINPNTGFVCGGFNAVGGIVIKTTNGGINWFSLNASFANHFKDMFVLVMLQLEKEFQNNYFSKLKINGYSENARKKTSYRRTKSNDPQRIT